MGASLHGEVTCGETEWERLFGVFSGAPDDDPRELLRAACCRDLVDGHAFTPSELRSFCGLVRPTQKDRGDDYFHRHLDCFVIHLGLWRETLISKPTSERTKYMKAKLIAPLKDLTSALEDAALQREFMQPERIIHLDDLAEVSKLSGAVLEKLQCHERAMASTSKRGKTYDHDLKSYHVKMVDALIEYFNPNLEPSRPAEAEHGWFDATVHLLASPIFSNKSGLRTAARNFVRDWRIGKNQLEEEVMAKKRDA